MKNELVSIIIPTYKGRGGLIKSIESVLCQSYINIELIVVDDNTPLCEERYLTENIMDKFSLDERVKFIQHEYNKNGAAARNTGIKEAKGKYIAFLDDDDTFLPQKIAKQVAFLEDNTQFDAVYCLANNSKKNIKYQPLQGQCIKEILMLTSHFYTPTLMFRADKLHTINGFDESFIRHQDYDLMLRYFAAGFSIGCVPEVLTIIGINKGENIPKGKQLDKLKDFFFEKFKLFIDKIELTEPGFRNKVYAKHYAGVFLQHVKFHYWNLGFRAFNRGFWRNPIIFLRIIFCSIKAHI